MKKIIILFVLFIRFQSSYCQENITQDTKQKIDSLLQMIDIENDDNKRFALLLNTYHYIIDTSPYLILEISQKLYKISKKTMTLSLRHAHGVILVRGTDFLLVMLKV